jgi:predicted dehydrogenase
MLKAGFIGFGRMGITHFSILNTHPSVEVTAVSEQSTAMLKMLGKYLHIKTYADYGKMLSENKLDCAIISTPGDSHVEISKACLERGLSVFVEKPFAMTAENGREVLTWLGGQKLANQVGYVNRFNDVFLEVKRLLDAKIIGDVKTYTCEMYGPIVLKDSKSGWRSSKKTGGGCLYEFASHCIDLALYFFGEPDSVTGSVLRSIYSSQVEDYVSSTFLHGSGCTGSIIVNQSDETYRKPTIIVRALGTKGKVTADMHAFKLYLKEADGENGFSKGWNTRYITDFARGVRFYVRGNEFTRQLDYFVECAERRQSENIASFSEGFKTDMAMELIRQDAMHAAEETAPKSSAVGARSSTWRKLIG